MFVKAKQSGELLSKEDGELWTMGGVRASAEKISSAYKQAGRLGLEGLMVVSGAGNIIRGEKLRGQGIANGVEDVLGRLATIQNTLVLSEALKRMDVPHTVFLASSMGFHDETIGTIEPHDIEAEREAYQHERWVLIAGGTGEDGKTTDNAVMHYGDLHHKQWPEEEVIVLKGTKQDGVYEHDPVKNPWAKRFSVISAHTMLADYKRYAAVDRPCLESIIETGLSMRVYRDGEHDLEAAVRKNGGGVGTLIVPDEIESVFA